MHDFYIFFYFFLFGFYLGQVKVDGIGVGDFDDLEEGFVEVIEVVGEIFCVEVENGG